MAMLSTYAADDERFMALAIEEARTGYSAGGIPIGSVLISPDGKILGRGHNQRIQKSSPTLHAEIHALESAGRLPPSVYKSATIYTTLSPCSMCSGAILLYGIPRVVVGENKTFMGAEEWLKKNGVTIVYAGSKEEDECKGLMDRFIREKPEEWGEDIGTDITKS